MLKCDGFCYSLWLGIHTHSNREERWIPGGFSLCLVEYLHRAAQHILRIYETHAQEAFSLLHPASHPCTEVLESGSQKSR